MMKLETWDEALIGEVPEVKFHLENYIPVGGVTLLYGKYGTFKTPITINMAAALGGDEDNLWGLEVAPVKRVLYIEADTPELVLKPRLQQLARVGVRCDFYWCYPGFNAVQPNSTQHDAECYSVLQHLHKKHGYEVVFIDSLRKLCTLKMTDPESPNRCYSALHQLFPDSSIVIIHHDKKTTVPLGANNEQLQEMDAESFSGSQAWIDHATVGVKVKHVAKDEIKLMSYKSQAGPLAPPLLLKAQNNIRMGPPAEVNLDEYDKIVKSLPPGLPMKELDLAVAEFLGVSERTARRYRTG